MPSLRRTASSPSVRSSPYHPSSSALAARARECRRSTASETSNRRVLADIDWWRVTEGQCDPNVADTDDTSLDGNREFIGDVAASIDVGVEHPSSLVHLPWVPTTSEDIPETLPSLPTAQFAALSIAPSTPPRHGRDSSSSSVESSPEPAENTLGDVPSELDMGFFDSPLPPLSRFRRVPRRTLAPSLARSFTFADTHSLRVESPSHYADFAISPLSSAPDFLN
ncbi:hypothetical protein D9756_001341 [Leucocoprinus leucothites]|uniref:Uncharacterized protein n=1 Tax=Leucocoprinus leucothites TaxID=201217 RepID=A0A8H5G589_9AGAR|nr:hypothetical protein D9756_001341 [Leucoagaricus leucothites]